MRLQPSETSEAEAEEGGAEGGAEEEDSDDEGGIGSLCIEVSLLVAASCAVGPSVSRRSASTSETASMQEGVRLIAVCSAPRVPWWEGGALRASPRAQKEEFGGRRLRREEILVNLAFYTVKMATAMA